MENKDISHKNNHIIVQKYGGATLATPEQIKSIARQVARLAKTGKQVVVVVSAMGQATNDLLALSKKVSSRPSRRELDMLLTTGERVSMALVTMSLLDQGCPAISFTGSQAGILTNESHVNALIKEVQAFRVCAALKENKVVVLAGFQGVSPLTKEITTLGRGGTDTTAVAMAAFLGAHECQILKDVPSIFSADPKIATNAKQIHQLSFDQLLEMTFWGAKVLHYRSVELAKSKNIPLYIGPAHPPVKHTKKSNVRKSGTLVQKEVSMYEFTEILAVNSHSEVLKFIIKNKSTSSAIEKMKLFLDENEIPHPQILHIEKNKDQLGLFVTGPSEVLTAIKSFSNKDKNFKMSSEELCSVSATCAGATSNEAIEKMLRTLENHKIEVNYFFQSSMTSVFFIEKRNREAGIRCLHKLIKK